MIFTAFVTLALGVSSTCAVPFGNRTMFCASTPSVAEVAAAEAHFTSHKASTNLGPNAKFAATIPVYWHVLQSGTSLSQGNIPDSEIAASIKILNQDYAGAGLTFRLAGIGRMTNANWFQRTAPSTSYQTAMKQALRQGGASALNVYTVGFTNVSVNDQGLLGYATFPYSYSSEPKDDGVVIRYSTVPGGSAAPYNLGKTLTHQVGHWVGLYHTFQGGCSSPGDYVDDTPHQYDGPGGPTSGCPAGKDTCPDGGPDPIHNFMDSSDDSCKTGFTPGQVARLQAQMSTYRGVTI
ncbi:extracellular metalloprotease [Rhizoctonia solani]|uniref:Extracellular metalloprotease n=1 Tax=Rhizoctonia solani TaxID=456999 RepID=A0A8H8NTU7_9AGAM|nr:extracellular metalloprotease [Rhizoctonia solani]QRW18637.1 extracellular metalloprotease [Rhizoctonia solani]